MFNRRGKRPEMLKVHAHNALGYPRPSDRFPEARNPDRILGYLNRYNVGKYALVFLVLLAALPRGSLAAGSRVPLAEYPDYHVAGGTLQTTIRNEALCKAQCGQTGWCVGVDFDFSTLTCWFHSTKTVCNSLLVLAGTNHYKYVDCRKPTVYLLLITWLYLVNNDNFRLNKFQFWLKFSMS
ncbi:hypothetical protein LSH36_831g00017 [Paralvinella palmiformis]|uniref:Uncharacterized protein n=1 Tax=Paralvinella palmiformis TaxID=53620 RepID=A0AAD9IZQ9_9ANNE|nr:hypothetical protein LSH36_831g00017 [Paralvinella palmiformis]